MIASDSLSSRSGASPFDPNTTSPASRVCIQRATLPARLLWSTDSLLKGVGIGGKTPSRITRKLYHAGRLRIGTTLPGGPDRDGAAHAHVLAGPRQLELRPHEQHVACRDAHA